MKKYEFGIWNFKSQKDLDNEIKLIFKKLPFNVEINNEFLLAIINNFHTDVISRGLKCTKLKVIDWSEQVGEWDKYGFILQFTLNYLETDEEPYNNLCGSVFDLLIEMENTLIKKNISSCISQTINQYIQKNKEGRKKYQEVK